MRFIFREIFSLYSIMLNIGKWLGYAYDNKTAIAIGSQDQLRSQLRNTTERKPDAYKSINSSAIRFQYNTNLTAK